MRRYLGLLILPFLAASVSAQIIHGGQGAGGTGGSFTSPGAGIIVDTDGAGTLAGRTITAGSGISVANGAGAAGNPSVTLDTSFAAIFSSGTGSVSATGAIGTLYFETDRPGVFTYPNTDTAHWLLSIPAGTAAGDLFQTSAADTLAVITSTDDNVLVSNGSTWEKKAIADCTDTGGNHLNYTASSNSFSCGTSGGGSPDISTTITVTEEFVTGTTTSGQIGTTGMTSGVVGTGTTAYATGITGHPGLFRLSSHATNDNSGASIAFENGGGSQTWSGASPSSWDTTVWSLDAIVNIGSNGTAITSTGFQFGLTSVALTSDFAGMSRGIMIRRNTDLSDTAFVFVVCNVAAAGCASAGDDTHQDSELSTITPSAGNYYRFRISQDMTGPGATRKISFRVNNETAVTFCSSGCTSTVANVPTDIQLRPVLQYLTRTTTGVLSADVDYMSVTLTVPQRY